MPLQNDDRWFRVGAAAVGILAGMVLGVCMGMLVPDHFAPAFFGAVAAGGLTGAVFPEAGLSFGEGMVHFVVGAFAVAQWSFGVDLDNVERTVRDNPRWLQAAFCFGVAYGLFWWALTYV